MKETWEVQNCVSSKLKINFAKLQSIPGGGEKFLEEDGSKGERILKLLKKRCSLWEEEGRPAGGV